ncbi:polysaccharide deacetylase family sporulation protein PdaB [Gorillibacterium sp. sgz5001074]|uniref:polysaccharide deacetylase family sporulation protein PdaB n=1 Tax=Gorillibacterium sp. sgz5001074 TaxID=3446695 RepID=UPI003F665CC8
MNFFYVVNGKRLKQMAIIVVACFFAAGIIYAEKENISVFSLQEPAAVYSVPTEKKVVALTFDISWGEVRTEPILQILEQKKVQKATFFLSSPWSKSHPDIVNQIVKSGYEIGSHGHKHTNYSGLSDDEIRSQIQKAHSILTEVTGKSPNLIRLPNGDFNKRVLRVADELGYKVIQWGTDSLDWKASNAQEIVDRVTSKTHPGDIILLHASDSVKYNQDALPQIIDRLREQGYEFVSVSELMEQSSITTSQVDE